MSSPRKPKFSIKKILLIANYAISTHLVGYLSQFAIGYPLIFLVGLTIFQTPLFSAIYNGLAYCFAAAVLIFLPQLILKLSSRYKKLGILSKIFKPWQTNREELGLEDLPTLTDLSLSVIGFALYTVLSVILVKVFEIFSWFQANQTQDVGFSRYLIGTDRAFAFIALVIFAPIFEEIIYRGWLFGHLRKITKKSTAIILTSIVFGIAHGQWNVGVNVFGLSIILCILREFTGTIYASILLHMIKNCIAFYLMYVVGFV